MGALLTPGTDTFVIIYSNAERNVYSAQTYARAGQTTEIVPPDFEINTYTTFSSFNSALASVGQPTTSFNPFEDSQPPGS